MDPQVQQMLDQMSSRISSLEATVAQPTHYHNGFDSNNISYLDLVNKKIYVRHTIYGTDAATAANYGTFLIVPAACLVTKAQEVHEVKGTDGSAVTLNVEKLTGTTAPGSGSTLLPTAFDLKGTINTLQTGTLTTTASTRSLAAGDRLALKKTGTLTSVAGVTVHVELQF